MNLDFIKIGDGNVVQINVRNDTGLEVSFLTFGASVYRLKAPNRAGISEDIIITPSSVDEFMHSSAYYGKTIGRTSGRIKDNIAFIQGQKYIIDGDHSRHALHGGETSWAYKNFDFAYELLQDGIRITFGYVSRSYESNFPGMVKVKVVYFVCKNENTVLIEYDAHTSEATLINMTNHAYFNLSGNYATGIGDHILKMNTPYYYAIDENLCLTEKKPVNLVMDFTGGRKIGEYLHDPSILNTAAKGYDHTFTGHGNAVSVSLHDPLSGRYLEISSSLPAVNIYSDNYPTYVSLVNGKTDTLHNAIAIEPEYVPTDFDSYTFHHEMDYRHFIKWSFSLM